MSGPVAVIDIGSNSIKVLVAVRGADGSVLPLHVRSLDTRISAGLSQAEPRLGEEGMARGLEAIRTLLADANRFSAEKIVLVATSAVRDARNGADFRARVQAATGHAIRILTGEEEANLIGRGLTCDPALRGLRDFYVFDLGGGSLECLAFRDRCIAQAASLQLGCVRLTEKFVADPTMPLTPAARAAIATHTRAELTRVGFRLTPTAEAIGTGGTVATARAILGARQGLSLGQTDPLISLAQMREMLAWLGALPLAERQRIPGLPAARADVFPTALVTFIAVAELGGFSSFRNSLYNLRYGLADATLGDS
ncbi:MAG: phosphatase [Opitutaceae bacterium]|nr:phosphatase [Opitutaceae bacterium]